MTLANRIMRAIALGLIFAAVSAGLLNLLYVGHGSYQIPGVNFFNYLDLSVEKPFAYRVLIPNIVATAEPIISAAFPKHILARFGEGSTLVTSFMRLNAADKIPMSLGIRYHLAYVLEFVSIFCWLLSMRAVASKLSPSVSPVLPSLCLAALAPILFASGQTLYDYPELAFLTLLFYASITQKMGLFAAVYPLAILNKEADIFAIVYLVAFMRKPWKLSHFKLLAIPCGLGLAAFVLSHWQVRMNPGGTTQFHLQENLIFILDPKSYFLFSEPIAPYIYLPRGYNVLLLGLVAWICFTRWRERPLPLRVALCGVGAINCVLMLFFGFKDEIRNFSLLIPLIFAHSLWFAAALKECQEDRATKSHTGG